MLSRWYSKHFSEITGPVYMFRKFPMNIRKLLDIYGQETRGSAIAED
jgi:hypothetical protein